VVLSLLLRLRLGVVVVVVVLSLWLRVPRVDWDCSGWSWRRADTGTTVIPWYDPGRCGTLRYGIHGAERNRVPGGVRSLLSRCSWVPILATLESRFLVVEDG
jgi:hypothetical protein